LARIRSIVPELLRSPKFGRVSPAATGCLLGLFPHVDDTGRYAYSWQLVKADVWPMNDGVDQLAVVEMVEELVAAELLCWYVVGSQAYFHVVDADWKAWQRIDHPSASRCPPCPRERHGGHESPRELSEFLASPREPSEVLDDPRASRARAGREGKGLEGSGVEGSNTVVEQARPASVPTADVATVFEAWKLSTGKARASLDGQTGRKRRFAIQRALRDYPLRDVLDAVQGWQNDPWPERPQHVDITQLLRDADHIEKFRDLWRDGPPAVKAPMTRSQRQLYATDAVLAGWAEEVDGSAGNGVAPDRRAAQRELPGAGADRS